MIHGISPVQTGNIVSCGSRENLKSRLKIDIKSIYESTKPIILFIDFDDLDEFEQFCKKNEY
jgi:hypothetical protein